MVLTLTLLPSSMVTTRSCMLLASTTVESVWMATL